MAQSSEVRLRRRFTPLLIGLLALPFVFIAWLVLVVVAGIKAANGEFYRYPGTIRFLT